VSGAHTRPQNHRHGPTVFATMGTVAPSVPAICGCSQLRQRHAHSGERARTHQRRQLARRRVVRDCAHVSRPPACTLGRTTRTEARPAERAERRPLPPPFAAVSAGPARARGAHTHLGRFSGCCGSGWCPVVYASSSTARSASTSSTRVSYSLFTMAGAGRKKASVRAALCSSFNVPPSTASRHGAHMHAHERLHSPHTELIRTAVKYGAVLQRMCSQPASVSTVYNLGAAGLRGDAFEAVQDLH
jgi:hypothetical protein